MTWVEDLHYRLACWMAEDAYPDAFDSTLAFVTMFVTIPLASFEFLYWIWVSA